MSLGSFTAATPSKAGPPRNIGQLVVEGPVSLAAAAFRQKDNARLPAKTQVFMRLRRPRFTFCV